MSTTAWAGSLAAMTGVALLAYSQSSVLQARWRSWLVATSLALLGLSPILWSVNTGIARGTALSLLAMMLTAGTVLGHLGWRHSRAHKARPERSGQTTADYPSRWQWLRVAGGTGLVVCIAGGSAFAIAGALPALAGALTPANRVGLALFLAPLLWALLGVLAMYAMPLKHRTAALAGALAAAVAMAATAYGVSAP